MYIFTPILQILGHKKQTYYTSIWSVNMCKNKADEGKSENGDFFSDSEIKPPLSFPLQSSQSLYPPHTPHRSSPSCDPGRPSQPALLMNRVMISSEYALWPPLPQICNKNKTIKYLFIMKLFSGSNNKKKTQFMKNKYGECNC